MLEMDQLAGRVRGRPQRRVMDVVKKDIIMVKAWDWDGGRRSETDTPEVFSFNEFEINVLF